MALLKYLKKKTTGTAECTTLPNPEYPLSDLMPSPAIAVANSELKNLVYVAEPTPSQKRGWYLSYTGKEKAQIGKRAAEFGVTNMLRYFSKEFADHPLKESTV